MVSKSHVSDTNSMNTEKNEHNCVTNCSFYSHFSCLLPSTFYGSPDPSVAALRHRHIFKGERPKRSYGKQRIFQQRRFRSFAISVLFLLSLACQEYRWCCSETLMMTQWRIRRPGHLTMRLFPMIFCLNSFPSS